MEDEQNEYEVTLFQKFVYGTQSWRRRCISLYEVEFLRKHFLKSNFQLAG